MYWPIVQGHAAGLVSIVTPNPVSSPLPNKTPASNPELPQSQENPIQPPGPPSAESAPPPMTLSDSAISNIEASESIPNTPTAIRDSSFVFIAPTILPANPVVPTSEGAAVIQDSIFAAIASSSMILTVPETIPPQTKPAVSDKTNSLHSGVESGVTASNPQTFSATTSKTLTLDQKQCSE